MEDEIIIHRQIINHYSRPDLAPQLWNYSSTLANNNNGLYCSWTGWEKGGVKERTVGRRWKMRGEEEGGWEKYQPERWRTTDDEGKKMTGEEENMEKFSLPNSVLESRVIITALGPSIVCLGMTNPAKPISIHLYWSYCQRPAWQGVKWGRQRKRYGMGGKCSGTRDRKDRMTDMKGWVSWHFLLQIDCSIKTSLYTSNASCS